MENARELALEILLQLEKGEGFDGKLINAVLDKYDYLDKRDKAFIKRLTEGTTERRIELDYHLDQYSKVPVKKMKPLIRSLMRMSVYQIIYMDSVPDSAACNEAVKLTQRHKFGSLKGFVNGVLRAISRNKGNLIFPDPEKEPVKSLSVRYSMPEWIVSMWMKRYGGERTEKILDGLLKEHPVSIRISTCLAEEERERLLKELEETGAKIHGSPYLPYVFLIENIDNIKKLPGFKEGLFTVQDVSSCLSVEALSIKEKDVVMDLCAAPGGKTILAAEKADRVYSFDLSEEKVELIRENLSRMKLGNVTAAAQDATEFHPEFEKKADIVIMDVPCSGLGVIGKKRDIKYRVSREGIESLVRLQKSIVNAGFRYVKPGGILIYSTCTINASENEEMAGWIGENFPFEPVDVKGRLPGRLLEDLADAAAVGENYLQLLPGFCQADGFFFALFKRKDN